MERKERFKEAFEYLRTKGEVHTQADVAERMKASRPNVSSAFSGDTKCLTDKFLIRFNRAFGQIFNDNWLMTGEGEMLRPAIEQKIGNIKDSQLHEVNVVKGDPNAYNTLLRVVEAHQKTTDNFQKTTAGFLEATNGFQKAINGFQRNIEKSQEQIDRLLNLLEAKQ